MYNLRVVVEKIEGFCDLPMKVGDYFEVGEARYISQMVVKYAPGLFKVYYPFCLQNSDALTIQTIGFPRQND